MLEPLAAAEPELVPSPGLTELAAAALGGDRRAADRLWEEAGLRLRRVGLALGARPEDVPDLVQDTLIAAHRHLRRFDPARGTFEAWAAAILVRRAKNLRRAEGRRLRLLDRFRLLSRPAAPSRTSDEADARAVLDLLLRSLTESQREVVALYEIGELSAEETAGVLDITAGGVRSIARDARRRLAEAARKEKRS